MCEGLTDCANGAWEIENGSSPSPLMEGGEIGVLSSSVGELRGWERAARCPIHLAVSHCGSVGSSVISHGRLACPPSGDKPPAAVLPP